MKPDRLLRRTAGGAKPPAERPVKVERAGEGGDGEGGEERHRPQVVGTAGSGAGTVIWVSPSGESWMVARVRSTSSFAPER